MIETTNQYKRGDGRPNPYKRDGEQESSCDYSSAGSAITRCEICKQDCGTMTGLIVHVRKFHPSPKQ